MHPLLIFILGHYCSALQYYTFVSNKLLDRRLCICLLLFKFIVYTQCQMIKQ